MTETESPSPQSPGPQSTDQDEPLFVRPREGRMIAGVCAGIAKRWNLDITLVRIATVALTLISGIGLAVYLAAWLLTPSTDRPAALRPGGRGTRWASRLPALILIVIAAIAIAAVAHTLWWGAPVGLLIAALVIAVVVGTRRGRWFLASVAALLVLALATIGVFGQHFGSRSYHVSSIGQLRDHYGYGAGKVNLDLTGLSVTGRHRTEVRLGRGDVNVTVPNNVAVWVHGRAGVGSVTIDGHKVDGI
ncbi:MAG TPA: PspC domain-containing protein, partial [Micromonosporaceae bacterium]